MCSQRQNVWSSVGKLARVGSPCKTSHGIILPAPSGWGVMGVAVHLWNVNKYHNCCLQWWPSAANKVIQPHALYHASLEQASPWRSGGFKVPCSCWLAIQDRMGQGCSVSSGHVGFHETVMHTAAMVKTVSFSQIQLECLSLLRNI